jgi:hypothetical protein
LDTTETQLARIGFGDARGDPAGWQVVRLGRQQPSAPRVQPYRLEPGCSRALQRWRDRLAGGPDPSPYRISRIDGER